MTPTLERTALEATFADVQLLIYDTIHKFIRRHGGEWDELLSEAHWLFLVAYHKHDGARSSFGNFVHWVLWKGMLEYTRKSAQRNARMAAAVGLDEYATPPRSTFNLADLAEGLTRDARLVLMLTLDSPREVAAMHVARGGGPVNLRSSLRTYLRSIGWDRARISNTFTQIQEAIYS